MKLYMQLITYTFKNIEHTSKNNLPITTFKIVIHARAYNYNKMLGDCKKNGRLSFSVT